MSVIFFCVGKTCPHITKAINFSNVKKVLKNNCLGQCQVIICDLRNEVQLTHSNFIMSFLTFIKGCVNSSVKTDELSVETAVVWLCLQCGNQVSNFTCLLVDT